MAMREIDGDTLVSTLTRRGRHHRNHIVTFGGKKQLYFSEKTHAGSVGFEPGTHA